MFFRNLFYLALHAKFSLSSIHSSTCLSKKRVLRPRNRGRHTHIKLKARSYVIMSAIVAVTTESHDELETQPTAVEAVVLSIDDGPRLKVNKLYAAPWGGSYLHPGHSSDCRGQDTKILKRIVSTADSRFESSPGRRSILSMRIVN